MPNSISSVKIVPWDGSQIDRSISRADNIGELLDLVPAPFRPRMQVLVNKVYRAAIKSNHSRSYLMTFERHEIDKSFPPEIGGRVSPPALQISKEFNATAEWRSSQQAMDNAVLTFKQSLLSDAIKVKKAEVAYLQGLFSEHSYKEDVTALEKEVLTELASDAGVQPSADGSTSVSQLPKWIQDDAVTFNKHKMMYPQRAIALAFVIVQTEAAKKFKSLTLKRKVDVDVEMQDAQSQNQTVDALVTKKVEALLKEHNIQQPRKKKAKTTKSPPRKAQKANKGGVVKARNKNGKKKSSNKSRN